mmetsp:Transcript_24136/g.57074  ORF Transcript_24136/g.57074 Transcript_24136/m.57074 type:complete len:582 (+) Transcript_24136:25-1770(+)
MMTTMTSYHSYGMVTMRSLPLLLAVFVCLLPSTLLSCHAFSAAAAAPGGPVSLPPPAMGGGKTMADHLPLAKKAMEYFDESTDPFLAVQTSIEMLKLKGYEDLDNGGTITSYSSIRPGGKYYYTRNKSTLVAFCVGGQYKPTVAEDNSSNGGGGFVVIGGHTDSPNLRVKPRSRRGSAKPTKGTPIQIGAECYGGGLWHTWFDRDLGISGRVFVRNDDGTIQQRLIKIDRAVLRIPNLAIHLNTAKEREAFKINKEDHLSPILAMAVQKGLEGNRDEEDTKSDSDDDDSDASKSKKDDDDKDDDGWTEYQEPLLLQLLSHEMDVPVDKIVDFELSMFDIQKANLGGVHSEFVFSARLDNLASCFLAVEGLVQCTDDDDFVKNSKDISMVVLYDHEEVGSSSAVGAASPILGEAVKRISSSLYSQDTSSSSNDLAPYDLYETVASKSFVLSSDQAHALHPNYASKHEKNHQPQMNGGMVIKRNANQRYATTGATGVLMREIARRASLPPVQEFIVRQDCGCGSTIGPLISTSTGIRAIDMGCPQLSMHSIREQMGTADLTNGLNLFKAYFQTFREVDDSLEQ